LPGGIKPGILTPLRRPVFFVRNLYWGNDGMMGWIARLALGTTSGALLIAAAAMPAIAAGALAIGEPERIEKRGVAVGTAYNFKDRSSAEAAALRKCLDFKDAPPDTRALCKVIESFDKECYAIALDLKAGTPGFGWAIKADKAAAEDLAMANCRKTAGKARVDFCKLTLSDCDKFRPAE